MPGGRILRIPTGVDCQSALVIQLPIQRKGVAFYGFCQVANGEILETVTFVETAGKDVADPIQVAAVVHMAVPIQVCKADGAAAAAGKRFGNQRAGGSQFAAPQYTLHGYIALTRQNQRPAAKIHQHPQADGAEALVSLCVVGYAGTGEGSAVYFILPRMVQYVTLLLRAIEKK